MELDEATLTLIVLGLFIAGLIILFFALMAFAGPRTREEREIATLVTCNTKLQKLIDEDKRELKRLHHLIDKTQKAA